MSARLRKGEKVSGADDIEIVPRKRPLAEQLFLESYPNPFLV